MIGALALFAGQLFFQLRPTIREEPIAGAQILVDHTDRVIVAFQATNMIRAVVERDAAKWLISNSEAAFDGEDGKPVRDLLILSILNYIAMMHLHEWLQKHGPALLRLAEQLTRLVTHRNMVSHRSLNDAALGDLENLAEALLAVLSEVTLEGKTGGSPQGA